MTTELSIDGEDFFVNGRPTYEGRVDERGRRIEGLLFNSRMVQAIFDDAEPATRPKWAYPDTGVWDPERNCNEFCKALPIYRAHGVMAVTVGLQGGGPAYKPEVYDRYRMNAFHDDGTLDPAFVSRLDRVLAAADACGMVTIANYFYRQQVAGLVANNTMVTAIERATEYLLATGYRNLIVDLVNEAHSSFPAPMLKPETVHQALEVARGVSLGGRRLIIGASTVGGSAQPTEAWLAASDVALPHGNGLDAAGVSKKVQELRNRADWRRRPVPVLMNEDGIDVANLDACVDHHCSWGYYDQGASDSGLSQPGAVVCDPPREGRIEELSGFQSPPVNWGINTPEKRAFFERTLSLAGGC